MINEIFNITCSLKCNVGVKRKSPIYIVPIVSIASTAVDRMALYLIPLQIVVWARFPVLMQGRLKRTSSIGIVIIYYAVVQFTWLVYATHAPYWVPYDNLLFPSF